MKSCVAVSQVRLSALTSSSSGRQKRPQRPRGVVTTAVTQPCRVRYAVLTDQQASPESVDICGGNGSRQRQVYVSTSNVVKISVDIRRDSPDYFVLLYEGIYHI